MYGNLRPRLAEAMCPRSEDLLGRCVVVVGVNYAYTERDAAYVVAAVRLVVQALVQ